MKIVGFQKLIAKVGNLLLALCLLALNSGPVSVADALTTEENNTTAAITSEAQLPGFMKGTQLMGTNTAFPSDSNEDGEHLGYVKQTGKRNFIGVQSSKSMMKNISAAAPVINNRILIDFSPYIDGQDPNSGTVLSESQIRQRLQIIAPYSKWIRTFSCGNGLEVIGRLAHEMNLQVAVNAWIGSADAVNQQQIACLINQANAGHVDLAIVGSEALLRGDVTPDTLIGYIDQVRQAIPLSIPVTTADVYTTFLENPLLVDHIDLIFANIYPFWEGYDVQNGIAMLNYYYNQLVATYPSKTIKISETGWPSCGSFGDAIGSLENEARYFSQVDTWARDKNVTLFYFDGLDESWKANYEGPQGGCWGIWYKNGVMKEGMSSVFDGTSASAPYDLTLPFTCGTDQFSFNFTYVPPYGNYENVQGQTCGIFHKDHRIVLHIKVGGNWWIKPYQNYPKTPINRNGTWSIDYTTGGVDHTATEIRAYLVSNDADPFGDLSNYPMISITRPTDANAFDKSNPVNGAANQPISPILSWGSSLNATLYEYCYDTTDDGTCSNWTSNGIATTKVLSGLSQETTYYWHVRGVDDLGSYYYSNDSAAAFWSFTTISDVSPPTVSNITRLNINPTNTNNVNFTVTFSESVTGVDTTSPFGDFALTKTGVTGATITGVIGSGATYTVTVNTGSGNGTIRLDMVDDNSIIDRVGNPLGGGNAGDGNFTGGETYTIVEPTFGDVPPEHWAGSFIERLFAAGITGGCGTSPLQYCPETTVTRSQMAVFLERGIHGSSYSPPALVGGTGFGDVPVDYWSAVWIKQLAAEGITGGCGSGNYCPEYPVTRDQMAVFLLRSKYGSSYSPPAVGTSTGFGDVPVDHWAAPWIKQLVTEGITAGCGSGNYCPGIPVSRAQMAVFLVRTFNLP